MRIGGYTLDLAKFAGGKSEVWEPSWRFGLKRHSMTSIEGSKKEVLGKTMGKTKRGLPEARANTFTGCTFMVEHLTDISEEVLAFCSIDSVFYLRALSHISWGWESGLRRGRETLHIKILLLRKGFEQGGARTGKRQNRGAVLAL